ncbi:MAG: hypothetical protein ABI600_08670 [Luteolibacter sp.]
MSTKIETSPDTRTRKQSAEAINRAMARFPVIVEILNDLSKAQIPFPGDDDLRHGCDRTLTTMLAELARIDPAPLGKFSKTEEIAHNWLKSENVVRLIDADKLQRIQQFIERILGTRPN